MSNSTNRLRKQRQLAAHAHRMRSAPSEPERVLWQALRSQQLGVQFQRQVVLQGYVVDFFAPAARLVVEVDGAHHTRQRGADRRRPGEVATSQAVKADQAEARQLRVRSVLDAVELVVVAAAVADSERAVRILVRS